jgi:hypothetical protein
MVNNLHSPQRPPDIALPMVVINDKTVVDLSIASFSAALKDAYAASREAPDFEVKHLRRPTGDNFYLLSARAATLIGQDALSRFGAMLMPPRMPFGFKKIEF